MKVLALETSDRIGSLAVLTASGDTARTELASTLPPEQRSAQSLLPSIQSLLERVGWKVADLDLIAVTTGPGSFTGLRISVTAAKTLAYATGAELVEVHTLAAMAFGVSSTSKRLWTILDAQRRELFVAEFRTNDGEQALPSEIPETRILAVESWLEELSPGDWVCGPPLKNLANQLPAEVHIADKACWQPTAEQVGHLGIAAYKTDRAVDAIQLVPRYYRKSAAEEKADAKAVDSK